MPKSCGWRRNSKCRLTDLVKMVKAGGQESIDELRTRILADKALDFVYRNAVIQG